MDHLEAAASSMLPPPRSDETVRYSQEEWNRHRPIIEGMYPLKGMCLKVIIAFLKEDRGFVINERQLKRKIKDWKLEKKVKGDEMKVIVQKMQQRVGKNTTFRVRGQTVEPAKIQRWQKRTETLDTPTMPTPLPESPAPSTPSDISYNTVQEIRSPSPYKQNIDSLSGLISELEGNLPASFSPPQNFGHMRSPQDDALGTNIASILVEDGNVFEGQSPAPSTAPPSPAPSQRHEAHGVSSNSSQHLVLGENLISSENDIHAPFSSSTAVLTRPPPIQTSQKKRYKQKEELELTQRLNDLQSKYGSDHAATVDTALRLVQIYVAQGRYRSSEHLCEQSAKLLQKSVGENDPRTLSAFNQLAAIFLFQSQYSKAKTLLQAVHSRASKALHPSHLAILSIKNEFARCLATIGNLVEAEQIFREVMVLGRTLPPDHGTMMFAMLNLAELLAEQGEYFEAEKILIVIYETDVLSGSLGDQLRTRSKLGNLWRLNGEVEKGVEALREVLLAQKQHFGPEHRVTLCTQRYFAGALLQIGGFVESEELFRDTINKFAKTLGRNHGTTLEAESYLSEFFNERQRFGEAEELQKQVLRVSEEVYGWENKLTYNSASALSDLYHRQGRLEEAHLTGEKAFRTCLQIFGPDHRYTRDCEHRLIIITQEMEQLQRSQDGASMSTNPQHRIVVEDVGFATLGISSGDLGGILQPIEG